MAKVYIITGVVKNGTLVSVSIEGKANPVTFDMDTRAITSYTGRDVMRFPVGDYDLTTLRENKISHLMFNALLSTNKNTIADTLSRLELFINNPELLERVLYASDLPSECPKGYIKWLTENDKTPTCGTLRDFLVEQAYKQMPKEDREVDEMLFNAENAPFRNYYDYRQKYLQLTPELRKKFNKILKASFKSFSWNLHNDIKDFIEKLFYNHGWHYSSLDNVYEIRPENWEELLDTERSFAWNIKNITVYAKKSFEELIVAKERQIDNITSLSNDKLVVIVPHSLEDFTNEGNMQRNCIGHYYHQSIAHGRNIVYFIRKAETPDKSYITNRFNVADRKTVESLAYCNNDYDDKDVTNLIKEIDKMIRTLI